MHISRRLLVPVAVTAAAACAVGLSASGAASADDEQRGQGRDVLRSGLVGSTPPADGGPTLFGVSPGGAPWNSDHRSSVRVRQDGRVDVKIRGLVIPGRGTGTVTQVFATVVCNGAIVEDNPVAGPAPLSLTGNARIRDQVDLPSPCLAPAVLVRPSDQPAAPYIAANGG